MMMRSRSELAVISRPPSLPMARMALSCPTRRPWAAAKLSPTARCSAPTRTSARRAKGSPAWAGGQAGRQGTGEDTGADQEHVLLPELAHTVEKVFVRDGVAERRSEPRIELRRIGQRGEKRRIDERIHDLRVLRQDVAKPRRGAE